MVYYDMKAFLASLKDMPIPEQRQHMKELVTTISREIGFIRSDLEEAELKPDSDDKAQWVLAAKRAIRAKASQLSWLND